MIYPFNGMFIQNATSTCMLEYFDLFDLGEDSG